MIWAGPGFEFDLTRKVVVIGVINVTPDSFSDGGRYVGADRAASHGLTLAAEGADVLDIGGESTRPGAADVPAREEIDRVVPVITALRRQTDVPLSIDTRKAEVARAALAAGAQIVNDVSALGDPAMAPLAAATDCGLILMHMQGTPTTMQDDPRYDDVVAEIVAFLAGRTHRAREAGVKPERLVIDPGIGFGKALAHNLTILKHLERFAELGYPVLVGPSRKRFIGALTGADVDHRVPGTLAAVALAVAGGARLVRVHDVAPAVQAVAVAAAIHGAD
jgi:dihydropteroate synthase